MIGRRWLVAAVLAGALFGCQKPPPEAFVSGTGKGASLSATPIGNDDAGEPCRYQLASGEGAAVPARRDASIYCGPWEQPKSHVFELSETADPARLDAISRSGT